VAEPVVDIQGLNYSPGGLPVLQDVDLRIARGDYLAVLGPNGGGKSTLLKLMLGLVRPDSGVIRVLGQRPGEAGGRIGYLPQHTVVANSFPITVLEAVCMGTVKPGFRGMSGRHSKRDHEKARQALKKVDMLDYQGRRLARLSGGQKQRVFIARALVDSPELLLLDEPTASVDSASRMALFTLLNELNKEMTVIMVSHDISSLASGVKSVACVNRKLHFHRAPEVTDDMFTMAYGGAGDQCCPVELVTHGHVPHRVLAPHEQADAVSASTKDGEPS
jgi:zinc transport system ATP-binding protein